MQNFPPGRRGASGTLDDFTTDSLRTFLRPVGMQPPRSDRAT